MKVNFALKDRCPLNRKTDVYRVCFTVALVYGNEQVAAITTERANYTNIEYD